MISGASLPLVEAFNSSPQPQPLTERLKLGCEEAFEELLDQYEARIFNYLYHLTRNRHDAEDLTQETFVKAYRNIHRYDSAYSFVSWLYTIAKRTAYSHLRSAKPFMELSSEIEAETESPDTTLAQKDAQLSVWRLAKKLKPKQYEALWLRYGEGFSVAEISKVMRTNQIYVKVLLHRGRVQLSGMLRRSPVIIGEN